MAQISREEWIERAEVHLQDAGFIPPMAKILAGVLVELGLDTREEQKKTLRVFKRIIRGEV